MAAKLIRPLRFADGCCYVPLTRGMEAIIDEADAGLVSDRNWVAQRGGQTFYGNSWGTKEDGSPTTLLLHRLVMSAAKGQEVDHINGNGLDNRRTNLRVATRAQNACNRRISRNNSSGLKGVWQRGNRWCAMIQHRGVKHHLGSFRTPETAYEAYVEAANRFHGKFARVA